MVEVSLGRSDAQSDFQRAYIAMRYFLGARGEDLAMPEPLRREAAVLLEKLGHPDRASRAETLAAEIGRVVRALEARTLR